MSDKDNLLMQLMQRRRSVRTYTGESIPDQYIEDIVAAGLLAPSARNLRPVHLIVVRDKDKLKKIPLSRSVGADMIADADACITVWGDESVSPLCIEDSCIAATHMLLMAEYLGVGAVWAQGRGRDASDGRSTEEYLRELLGVPDHMSLECLISLGMPLNHPEARPLPDTHGEMVHRESF